MSHSVIGRRAGSLLATGVLSLLLLAAPEAVAQTATPAPVFDAANTAWVLTATALVLFMTLPGLALFYGGLVRAQNVLSVLMQCFAICCVVSVLWLLVGYSLAFGEGGELNKWVGGLNKMLLAGVGTQTLTGTLPEVVFFVFQMTFAIITPALIVGAYVERIKFGAVMLFSALWLLIVYAPVDPLGVGRRLARRHGRAGLRRRPGGACHRRRLGLRARRDAGPAPRLPARGPSAAQPGPRHDGRGHAVGRLVRLQRRQRA